MDLIQFDGSEVVLRLYPSDCATLSQVLAMAEAALAAEGDEMLREAARDYAALFRALSLGGAVPGPLKPWNLRPISEDPYGSRGGGE